MTTVVLGSLFYTLDVYSCVSSLGKIRVRNRYCLLECGGQVYQQLTVYVFRSSIVSILEIRRLAR